jgi:hypothetical protein
LPRSAASVYWMKSFVPMEDFDLVVIDADDTRVQELRECQIPGEITSL